MDSADSLNVAHSDRANREAFIRGIRLTGGKVGELSFAHLAPPRNEANLLCALCKPVALLVAEKSGLEDGDAIAQLIKKDLAEVAWDRS